MLSVSSIENCHSINTYVHIKVLRIYNNIGYNRRLRKLRKATVQKMNALIWVIVAIKIFVVCWLIHMLLERRKRKRETQNVIIIEEGKRKRSLTITINLIKCMPSISYCNRSCSTVCRCSNYPITQRLSRRVL